MSAADEQLEATLDADAREYARLLVQACAQLGWGSDKPAEAAHERVDDAAVALGVTGGHYYAERPAERGDAMRRRMPKGTARKVWDRDEWTCKHCGTHKGLTVDHIVPVSKGGTNDLDNLQTLCGPCNSRKGDR